MGKKQWKIKDILKHSNFVSFHRECNTSAVGNIRSQYVYTASAENQ